jgi:hypothetical protein
VLRLLFNPAPSTVHTYDGIAHCNTRNSAHPHAQSTVTTTIPVSTRPQSGILSGNIVKPAMIQPLPAQYFVSAHSIVLE